MKTLLITIAAAVILLSGCATTGYKNAPAGQVEKTALFECKAACGAYDAYAPPRDRTRRCVNDCMVYRGFSN